MSSHPVSLKSLHTQLMQRQVSSVELATQALKKAETQSHLNAFTDISEELTLAQARAADARIAQGDTGALLGIPMAHKDIFVTRGWKSTAGSKMLANYVSPFDAAVVEKMSAAGLVCIGKLNCDEFAMGSSNENSAFGPVKNPWDLLAVPGGSSGGSAAAVAAGIVPLATGTDTGGSIRQPAALCGITGIKPTYGRVSRYGMIAYASSLDQGGPMAGSAEDCALALTAMAGFDARDSTSLDKPAENFERLLGTPRAGATESQPLKGLRVGLPDEFFASGVEQDVLGAVQLAVKTLEQLGAVAVPVSLPRTALSIPAYYVIAPAEASSNLSRFDGVRYGHRASGYKDLADMYEKTRSEGFGAEVKRRILVGAYVLSRGYYDAYYLQAQRVRRLIAQDFQAAFAQCDVIAGPVCPSVAWNLGEKTSDPIKMYLADIFTLGASLAGLPGMSVPVGFGQAGRPVGLQLIGNYFTEAELLQTADHFQRATQWHLQRPCASNNSTSGKGASA
jgi:aspartyl-tRNA(Asn)/glutamyl-tRNA(Gln) amidotransferase subunit A